jgi:hypothetical protein
MTTHSNIPENIILYSHSCEKKIQNDKDTFSATNTLPVSNYGMKLSDFQSLPRRAV